MSAKRRAQLIYLLLTSLLMLGGLEVLLRLTDFDGRGAYAYNGYLQGQQSALDPRGYSLTPGVHRFSGWSATVLPDRTRFVPDTNPDTEATIYLIGDSLTFGFGVNDAETWVNHLATTCPAVRFINAGVSGFNGVQVARNLTAYPDADAYLWLTIANDVEPTTIAINSNPLPPTYTGLYLRFSVMGTTVNAGGAQNAARNGLNYAQSVERVLSDTRAQIVAFKDDFGRNLQAAYPAVKLIPAHTHFISLADRHPDVTGHQQIAEAILPLLPRCE